MITGKIKGGTAELIDLLRENKAKAWKIVYEEDKSGGATVFMSDEAQPYNEEIERMKRILAKTAISRAVVIITPESNRKNDNMNLIKYEFSNNEPAAGAVSGFNQVSTATGYSREDVDRMVSDGIEKALMKHELEDLRKERREFEREKREFEAKQNGAIGMIVDKLGGAIMQRFPGFAGTNVAVAGLEDQPDDEEQEQPQQDPAIEADPDAVRLSQALKQFAAADPEYIDVICKLVEIVVSGKPIAGMPYSTVKSILMKM